MKSFFTYFFIFAFVLCFSSAQTKAKDVVIKSNFEKATKSDDKKNKLKNIYSLFENLEESVTDEELKKIQKAIRKQYPNLSQKEQKKLEKRLLAVRKLKIKVDELSLKIQERIINIDEDSIPQEIKELRQEQVKKQKQIKKHKTQKQTKTTKAKDKNSLKAKIVRNFKDIVSYEYHPSFMNQNGGKNEEKEGDLLGAMKKNFNFLDIFFYDLRSESPISGKLGYGNWAKDDIAWARIATSKTHIGKSNIINASLHLYVKKGFYFPWQYQKNVGKPPVVDFSKSKNIKNIKIYWPYPKRFSTSMGDFFGYRDNFIIPIKAFVKKNAKKADLAFDIKANVCDKEKCVPQKLSFDYSIYKGKGLPAPSDVYRKIALRKVPKKNKDYFDIASIKLNDKNEISIEISADKTIKKIDLFIIKNKKIISSNPKIIANGKKATLITKLEANNKEELLTSNIKIYITGQKNSIIKNIKLNEFEAKTQTKKNMLIKIGFWFFLGIISLINPFVLSSFLALCKSFFEFGGKETSNLRLKFGIASAVISTSFALLAYQISFSDASMWWGRQFNNINFMLFAFLFYCLFFIHFVNFFDFGKIKTVKVFQDFFIDLYKLDKKFSNPYFIKNILIGFIAVIGVLLFDGFIIKSYYQELILEKNKLETFFCILFFGFGLSFAYFIVFAIPQITKKISTNLTILKFINSTNAFLCFLSLIYCGFIVFLNTSAYIVVFLLFCFLGLLFLSSVYNSFSSFRLSKEEHKKYKKISLKILYSFFVIICFAGFFFVNYFSFSNKQTNQNWIKYDKKLIEKAIENEQVVFLNISADWSIVSFFNNLLVLDTDISNKKLSYLNVMRLRADWSDFDKDVTNLMKKYNKIQAPANILFGPLAKKGMLLKTYQSRTYIEDRVNNVKENKKDIFLK